MKYINTVGMDKDSFHEWVLACCDTFVRNEDKLFILYENGTRAIDITFPMRANELAQMIIEVNKIVQNNEEKIIVIKNLEDKENENEINNENE